jgi:hypothetical protein
MPHAVKVFGASRGYCTNGDQLAYRVFPDFRRYFDVSFVFINENPFASEMWLSNEEWKLIGLSNRFY